MLALIWQNNALVRDEREKNQNNLENLNDVCSKKKQQQQQKWQRRQACTILLYKKENYAETIEKTDGQHIVGVFFYAARQMGLPLEWRMLL